MSEGLAVIEREIATLEQHGDPAGLAEAYREAAKIVSHMGHTEEADRLFEQAVVNAKRSDRRQIESDVLMWRLAMQCWGYLPAAEGIRVTAEILERAAGGMAGAFALVVRGRYRSLQGDLTGGRADMRAGRALIREYGAAFYIAGSGQENGELELEAGESAAAELVLRDAYERYERMGGGALSSSAAALLSRALVDQGKFDEAEQFAKAGERTAPADDVFAQIELRTVRSRVLASRGELEASETLAREAVAIAERTDYLEHHAMAWVALAELLAQTGSREQARTALEEAIRLYERKGSVFRIEQTQARLRELAGEPLPERE
jgi:tetratricopeptide (TPR) repeat protein